ncbi:Kinesin-like protein KIF26B [Liparis tanakae]|uniref:Kinesin-like protein KIF26B n=1 Tax=Liparis tanakae TaxID=230148 RepID=A0A4Z2H4K6_9TELE|nr:Kinesin-like protein KIF26B [Liparis tanakae]
MKLCHNIIQGTPAAPDPSFSLLLHDKLQVPNSSRRAWNERDSRCDVCATHLTQLKQEAVRMVLTLDQWDLSPPSSPPALFERCGSQGSAGPTGASGAPGGPGSREWIPAFLPSSSSSSVAVVSHPSSQSPSPSLSQTPTPSPSHGPLNPGHGSPTAGPTHPQPQGPGHRLGSKPSSLGLGGGADRRNGSPSSGKAAQPVTGVNSTGNNSGNGSTTALQAHQHLNRTNGGVTLYPYQDYNRWTGEQRADEFIFRYEFDGRDKNNFLMFSS